MALVTQDGGQGRTASLAAELFREVRPDFFRVLSGANAGVYLDILNALETEASCCNEGMAREEALAMVMRVLANHPDFQIEATAELPPEATVSLPVREKARYVLDHLIRAGWLEMETAADWRRTVYFDPHGATLLAGIRKIAYPDAAVFTDKLVGVCAALANQAELVKQPWEHIQASRDSAQQGLAELRAMSKSVERFIRRQLEAQTLGDNLNIVFDQYAEQFGHTCYAELVRSQLHNRLSDARDRLEALLEDADLLHKMQAEVMRRNPSLDASAAMARVRNQLDDLERALDSVAPMADRIDARTAEFTRRSLARFRYLQEVVGERRGQIKELFEKLNQAFAGHRYNELEDSPALPQLLLPEARLLAGRDSLYEPPRRRTLEENAPVEGDVDESLRERTRRQMENALRDSLNVARANHFVSRLPGGKGARIASLDFPMGNEDDLADVIALLLHAESAEARYRVEVPRVVNDAEQAEHDRHAACAIERFFVIKK